MTRSLTLAVLAVVCGLFWTMPLMAQSCPAPLDKTVGDIQAAGGEFIDLIDVRSDHFDQVLVVVVGNRLLIGGVKNGCMASPPLPIDSVEQVTPA